MCASYRQKCIIQLCEDCSHYRHVALWRLPTPVCSVSGLTVLASAIKDRCDVLCPPTLLHRNFGPGSGMLQTGCALPQTLCVVRGS